MRSCLTGFLAVLAILAVGGARAQSHVDPAFTQLLERCAPTVHPVTMGAVVSAESRGHLFAIADAGPVKLPWSERKALVRSLYPASLDAAVDIAENLIRSGHTVSLGMAQVNDRNLSRYGLTVRDVFEPCTNINIGGKILTDFYNRAVIKYGEGTTALRAAISAYNSGDFHRGEQEGYVNLVYQQLGKPIAPRTGSVVPRIKSKEPETLNIVETSSQRGLMTAREFVLND